jgi:hypothetical protein
MLVVPERPERDHQDDVDGQHDPGHGQHEQDQHAPGLCARTLLLGEEVHVGKDDSRKAAARHTQPKRAFRLPVSGSRLTALR